MGAERFLQRAVLDTIVPQASEIRLEDILGSSSPDLSEDSLSILSTIRQRDLLFFDELTTVYVVLRLTNCSEDALRSQLPRLSVKLESFAINNEERNEGDAGDSEQTRDLLYSGPVQNTEDPFVIVHQVEDDDEIDNIVFVVWKSEAFLNRPRVRLQHPSVVFVASATLSPQRPLEATLGDQYLPSLTPGSANVLQSLSGAGVDGQLDLHLPASRLLRVLPAAELEGAVYSIQQQSCNPFRVIPIASARVRYSRVNTRSSRPATIASLDFEVTPFTGFEVVLEEAELSLFNGRVENLTQLADFTLPIQCRPRDDVTLVYKLTSEGGGDSAVSGNVASTLNIYIAATILVSDDCRPKIVMQWKTNVELLAPLTPSLDGPSQAPQRDNRHAALSSVAASQGTSRPPSSGPGANRRSHSSTDLGVTISFSGPPLGEVGKVFRWDVLIVNRSDKPRKFAMAAIPRRRRSDTRKHATRPSSSAVSSIKSRDIAEAVADDNIVHAMQKNAMLYDTQVISLSTDIRVGPLPPGTCHLTELKLLPLSPGSLHMEAIRLIDLTTNTSVDIQDLPDIVIYPRDTA